MPTAPPSPREPSVVPAHVWWAVPFAVPLLLLGAVHDLPLLITAVVVGLFAATRSGERDSSTPHGATLASAALWSVVAASAIQLLPLPPALLRALSPGAAETWHALDQLLGQAGRYRPITLDVHATAFQLVTSAITAVFFDTCVQHLRSADRRKQLVQAIAVATVLFEVVAIAHPILGLHDKVYGLYSPRFSAVHQHKLVLAPLLNENHAAAATGVGTALLIGLAIDEEDRERRLILIAAASLSLAFTFVMMSRGGILVVLLEALVLGIYALRLSKKRRGQRPAITFLPLVLGAALAALAASSRIADEVQNRDAAKLEIWRAAYPMSKEFWFAGVGRGAFVSTFSRWEPLAGAGRRYTHPESWVLQLPLDLGYPLAAALVLTLAAALLLSIRSVVRRPLVLTSLVALVGLVVHDLADFASTFAGVQLLAAALLALSLTGGQPRRATLTRAVRAKGAALLVVAPILVLSFFRHGAEDDADAVAAVWQRGMIAASGPMIETAVQWHPGDPYLMMAAGVAAGDHPRAGPMLARAVTLGPNRAAGHFWLARWFVAGGRKGQAWTEYHAAVALAPETSELVLRDALNAGATNDELAAIADANGPLNIAARLLASVGRSADGIDDMIIQRYPPAVAARLRKFDRELSRGDRKTAEASARALIAAAPTSPAGYVALAKAVPDTDAIAVLEGGIAAAGDEPEILEAIATKRAALQGLDAARADLARLTTSLQNRGKTLETYHALLGKLELGVGHAVAALRHYRDAAAAAGHPDAYLEEIATAAERARDWTAAAAALRRLIELQPLSVTHPAALKRVESAALAPQGLFPLPADLAKTQP